MAASGVIVSEECNTLYQELKLGKKLRYIIFKINDACSEIEVEKQSASTDYDEFLSDLPENEPRYAIYDFEYSKGDAGIRNKICFYAWTPESSSIKQKMIYASSKDALRKSLVGLSVEIQGTDLSEVSHEAVLEKVSRGN